MRVVTIDAKKAARLTKAGGKPLKELESKAGVEITIKSEAPEDKVIEISGEPEGEWGAEQVLNAIGLGFAPKAAFKLLGDNCFLEVIDLQVLLGGNDNAISRYKSRIIGTAGKSKKKIEELSGATIAINDGPQIGILGEFEDVKTAKEAITRLLEGSQHAGVFAFLKNEKRKHDAEALGLNLSRLKRA